MTFRLPAATAALMLAAALSACSDRTPQQAPAETSTAAPADPAADPGRGRMLSERITSLESRISQGVADGSLQQNTAQPLLAEVAQIRAQLDEMLARTPGPLPQTDRAQVAQRLTQLETRLPQPAGAR